MKVWVRRIGIVVGVLVLLLVVAIGAVYGLSALKLGESHEATVHAFDPGSGDVREGAHLAATYGCTECHGQDLGGTLLVDGMPFARVPAPNLTSGRSDGALSDDEWELGVRHGIGPDGRSLFIMPSAEYVILSDQDLADIVAYARTLPAVTDTLPGRTFGPIGRMAIAMGQLPFATDLMPERAEHMPAPEKAPTREFGFYLTRLCRGCHGENLAGGPPLEPDAPPGPNLPPAGNLAGWTYEQFAHAVRTGETPDGRSLNPQFMPWPAIGQATDTELQAMWTYLSSLEPVPTDPAL